MSPESRFQDVGETIWSFVDDILVRCPGCERPAHVTPRRDADRGTARLTCAACGLARETGGVAEGEPRRCEHCNRWIPSADWKKVRRTARTAQKMVECPRCHHLAHSTRHWITTGQPEDPYFGLPLMLQARCCDEVLWAYNFRHLDLLGRLVGASVRERERAAQARGEVVSNATLLARLPRWIKAAKNRDAVLACIERLRACGAPGRR